MPAPRTVVSKISRYAVVVWLCLLWPAAAAYAQSTGAPDAAPIADTNTFTNPLLKTGPDPWVVFWKGVYIFSSTTQTNLTLRKTADLTDLRHAETKVVWTPEPGHAWSEHVWAPELHRWGDKWFIYFTADSGVNATHRIYVVENDHEDPMEGEWTFRGKIEEASDRYAIDPTVFEQNGQHYLAWSGWPGTEDGEQDLYLAHMSSPWTLDTPRTLIARPTMPWEQHGDLRGGGHLEADEGPEFLAHGDTLMIVFSASACWTDFYSLGLLKAKRGADLLDPKSWTKIDHPVFQSDPAARAYGPGHNGFFTSPDGTQNWMIYHANPRPGDGCGDARAPRMQPFTWNRDGTPNFGTPAPLGVPMQKPSATTTAQ